MNNISQYEAEQTSLLAQQIIFPEDHEIDIATGELICSLDIQYEGDDAYVGLALLGWKDKAYQIYLSKEVCSVPYQPGYFAFREGPVLVSTLKKLQRKLKQEIRLLIIDGHGTAHPRRMGLASWVGIKMGIASLGIAKDPLIKKDYSDLGQKAESIIKQEEAGEWIGSVFRSQEGIKPIFISAGHLISQSASLEIVKNLRGVYRIPEPIRQADQAARKFARGEVGKDMHILT